MAEFNTVKNRQESVRQRIFNAASKLMSEKGFKGTSISDIAQSAGLVDPLIYKYFEGKEDLLFSVVEDQMEKFHTFLEEQLKTIQGADNKLRKLIWAHLRFNDLSREYITLVLLECRANQRFYKSRAYELIRQYARRLMGILKEGVDEGVFRSELNLVLIRDIIFGLVDFQAISCLVTHEISEAVQDHEECTRLIQRILFVYPQEKALQKDKKTIILKAAAKVFAEMGYKNATISKIAGLAHVAEGTVYLHFKNKEDLLFSIADKFFQDHLTNIKKYPELPAAVKKMETFIRNQFLYYLSDQHSLVVYLMLVVLERNFYNSPAYQSWRSYIQLLEDIVQEGIEDGCFIPDINIRVFRNLFIGAFTHIVLRWFIVPKKSEYDKHSEVTEFTRIISKMLRVSEKKILKC